MSEPKNDLLAAALFSEREDVGPRHDCPTADQIWQAVRLELPQARRGEIIDHIADCPACAESWQLARELGARLPADAAPSSSASSVLNRRSYLAAAAVLTLLVGGIAYWIRPPVAPIARDPDAGVLELQIPSGSAFPKDDFLLRWTAAPSGSRYDIVVTTADLAILAQARGLEVPEYRVPAERLQPLAPGTRLLVRVVANTPDGQTLSSRTFDVTVR